MSSEANTTQVGTIQPDTLAIPEISAERPVGLVDIVLVAGVVGIALWYLYRILWTRRGGCSGCAKGRGDCAIQRGRAAAHDPGTNKTVQVPIDRIGHR